jgi:acetyl esterase
MLRLALERQALKRTLALPEAICAQLGKRLGTDNQLMLDIRLRVLLAVSRTKKPLNERSVENARAFYSELFQIMDVEAPASVTTHEHHMHVGGDQIHLRSYHPEHTKSIAAMPGLLFLHGGGFTIGSVEDYHRVISWMAEQTKSVIVSVDYRLGPEHPYPAAAEDAIAAWQWMCANTDKLGLDPTRLGVMGDSAGGNLAAVISQQAPRRGLPQPQLQCLIYPTLDLRMTANSISRYGEDLGLTRELIKWFRSHYIKDIAQASELLASPGLAESLSDQPATLLITATDPLRDEGLDYVSKLRAANVKVTHFDYPQLIHGFMGMAGVLPAARRAMEEICQSLAEHL